MPLVQRSFSQINDKLIVLKNGVDSYSTIAACVENCARSNGPFTNYIKFRGAHAPGMPGTVSPPPTSKETPS